MSELYLKLGDECPRCEFPLHHLGAGPSLKCENEECEFVQWARLSCAQLGRDLLTKIMTGTSHLDLPEGVRVTDVAISHSYRPCGELIVYLEHESYRPQVPQMPEMHVTYIPLIHLKELEINE